MVFYLITKVQEEVKRLLQKIISALCRIKEGNKKIISRKFKCKKRLGSCERLLLCNVEDTSTKKPDDYVIATGVQYSVKEFINLTAKNLI